MSKVFSDSSRSNFKSAACLDLPASRQSCSRHEGANALTKGHHCPPPRSQASPRRSMQGHCFLDVSLIMPDFNAIKRFPCKPHSGLSYCRPYSKMVIVNRGYRTLPCKSKPACCMDVLGKRRGGYYLEARGFLIAQQSSSLYTALDKRFFIPGAA